MKIRWRLIARRLASPRTLLAVGLVLIGLVAVPWAIGQASAPTEGYLVTVHQLNPATPITESDFANIGLNGGASVHYLRVKSLDRLIESGRVYPRRVIRSGEFVDAGDLITSRQLTSTQVSVQLSLTPSKSLSPGDEADLWATAPAEGAEPVQISLGAQVVEISAQSGSFGGAAKAEAELLVGQPDLPGILAALADGSQLALVPTTSLSIASSG
ncbi:MAG: hypothetical protein CGW95_10655 [Phenylobacterium zucineum]|nr:MAG: hypothetical protein CGW95_10655 [Phenylobacterium zucineum]